MNKNTPNWRKEVPIYKNGSTAIPKGELVVQLNVVDYLLTSQLSSLIAELEKNKKSEELPKNLPSDAHVSMLGEVAYNQSISDTQTLIKNKIQDI